MPGFSKIHQRLFLPLKIFIFIPLFIFPCRVNAYERIISLKPNLTEILFALGVGDKIVGVTTYCDFPPQTKMIDKVADYIQPNLEKLIAKNPDLIITSQENSSRREIEFLIHKGYPVLTYESDTFSHLRKTILELGEKLNRGEAAQKLVGNLEDHLAFLKKKAEGISRSYKGGPPHALFVVGHEPLIVAGSQNLLNEMAPYLGVINLASESRLRYPTYSLEMLLQKKPDLILDFSMGTEMSENQQKRMLKWWRKFSDLPAVQNHRIFFLDFSKVRAGPRLAEELEKLLSVIYK